jgi:catechol 2,3-dioxygenase-like lactoylglutathione lyase family enzyme
MRILESVLYAEDLEKAREFYEGVLGLEVIAFDPERDLFLRCEGGVLIIFKASRTVIDEGYVPPHGTTGHGHLAFRASHWEIGVWKEKLIHAGVSILKEIDWAVGARSIYFKDPAGNVLEFATPDLWHVE